MTSAARSDVWTAEDAHAPGFAALYRSHFTFTWSCLRRLGVPPAAIDDAAQELWVTAHRRLDQLRDARAAKSWLYAIARRVASHHRRSEHRHRRKLDAVSASAAIGWSSARPHDAASRESELIVEAILDQLDPRVREAFVLSELEGWTAPEIAKATGANTNTVYWRVRVAKQALQSQLAANDGALDAVVIQLRDGTRPPKDAAKKCMLALAPVLAKSSLFGGAVASFGALKAVLLAAVAGSVTLGAIEISEREPARVEATVVDSPTVARVAARAIVPEPPRPVAAARGAMPGATDVPVQVPQAVARARAASPEPVAAALEAPKISETQLLADARAAANDGDHARTRALLREHAQRFPNSALADMRDLLEAKTLCAQGETQAARAVVARIVERAPASAAATKAASICGAAE